MDDPEDETKWEKSYVVEFTGMRVIVYCRIEQAGKKDYRRWVSFNRTTKLYWTRDWPRFYSNCSYAGIDTSPDYHYVAPPYLDDDDIEFLTHPE